MEMDRRRRPQDAGIWLAGIAALVGAYGLMRVLQSARRPAEKQATGRRPRVAVLGAGFAGLEFVRKLHQLLPGRCDIVLVDQHNYQLFTPLLFQVAACGVDPYSITYPVHHSTGQKDVTFRMGKVTGIDLNRRRARLQDVGEVGFDYLVIALGSSTNYSGVPSAEEHALPIKSVGDAIAIRNHVLEVLERGSQEVDPEERKSLLTFAVVGGGSTGVETAAALSELLSHTVPLAYPALEPAEPRIVVVESSGKLLGHMKEPAAGLALDRLRRMGVEVWLNARVTEVRPEGLSIEDGLILSARTILWATGVRAPEAVSSMEAEHGEEGSLVVDQYLRVKGWPGVYAVGDCALVEDSISHDQVPWLAGAAVQEAAAAARNIARAIEGQALIPFHYRGRGTLISLGRRVGLAQSGRLVVDGVFGALAWHLVHLSKIPTFRERISTLLDWSAGYLNDRGTALIEAWPVPGGKDRPAGRAAGPEEQPGGQP